MSVMNVRSKWSSGNLQFTDLSQNVILEVDGPNRRVEPYDLLMLDSYAFTMGTGTDVKAQWDGSYFSIGPNSGFWSNCPYFAYPDLSLAFNYHEDCTGIASLSQKAATATAGGWNLVADSDCVITADAGSLGGQLQIAPKSGSNNELYIQLGEKGSETFIEYTKDSGKKSWVEFRVAYTSITNAANIIVGLADETAAAADFINDAGNDIGDNDLVGFVIWEGDPNAIDCIHQKTGGASADPGVAGVPVAGTFLTLGLYFDGAETVTYYKDGTAVQTADLDTATFPTGEELSPIIALKNGAADAELQLDWVRMVCER